MDAMFYAVTQASNNHMDIIRLLLESGANPNVARQVPRLSVNARYVSDVRNVCVVEQADYIGLRGVGRSYAVDSPAP
jgi:hypothetical protein